MQMQWRSSGCMSANFCWDKVCSGEEMGVGTGHGVDSHGALMAKDPMARRGWQGKAFLRFHRSGEGTVHQGGCRAPLKLCRAVVQGSTCEVSLLHTAGGLVGGDVLHVNCQLAPQSRALLTSVAAQKVYGSVGPLPPPARGRLGQATAHLRCGGRRLAQLVSPGDGGVWPWLARITSRKEMIE